MIRKSNATFCNKRGSGFVPADQSGPGLGVGGRSPTHPSSSASIDVEPAFHPYFLSLTPAVPILWGKREPHSVV